jgi:hypothetical protein
MKTSTWLLPLGLIAAVLPVAGNAAPASPTLVRHAQASIPFANHGGVDTWRVDGDRTVYFQDRHKRWFRATLISPAFDLPFTEAIGIQAGPDGALDRFGSVVVKGQRYPFASFERVDGPPVRHAKK